jgi:hypothetical protein
MYAALLPRPLPLPLPLPLIKEAQRLRLTRATPRASRQCVYKEPPLSQKLSSSLLSLVSSISAIYKADLLSDFLRAVISSTASYVLLGPRVLDYPSVSRTLVFIIAVPIYRLA